MSQGRFENFNGWELQALAQGISNLAPKLALSKQSEARIKILDELHTEFERREDLEIQNPDIVPPYS